MEPARQGWMGLALFVAGLIMLSTGGWSFETTVLTGRAILLTGGYVCALTGIVIIFVGVIRSEKD